MSQQEPWQEQGITEAEYFKRRYIEIGQENVELQLENMKLKERLGPAGVKMLERMKASEAENEKLKAELGYIAWTPKRNGDCGRYVAMSIELAREIEAVVDTLRRATWHDTVEGHAVVGRHSWERIQNALERLDAITKGDGG